MPDETVQGTSERVPPEVNAQVTVEIHRYVTFGGTTSASVRRQDCGYVVRVARWHDDAELGRQVRQVIDHECSEQGKEA